ncbi:unnamed protein product [Prunus armeniaca]
MIISVTAVPLTQSAPAPVQPVTPDMIQQMIISAFSALGLSGKPFSTSSPWYFDSGASHHMTNNADSLTNVNKYFGNLKIHTADGNHLPITATGDVSSSLTDVFVSPGLTTNLVSVGVDNDCKVEFSKSGCVVQDQQSRRMIAKGPKVGRLFPLQFPLSSFLPFVSCNFAHFDYRAWHKRLGHPNSNVLHDLLKSGFLGNKESPSLSAVQFYCNSCKLGKTPVLNTSSPAPVPSKPLLVYQRRSFATSHQPPAPPQPPPAPSPTAAPVPATAPPPLRQSTRVRRPPDRFGSSPLSSFTATLSSISFPSSYTQAMKHECWRKAVETELLALEENQTWDVDPCPSSVKPLCSKFVFSVKLRSDGSIDRYKAWLVALGNKQEYGLNYDETFAPVAKMTTVRTILALAASQSWPLHQMDVKNAFLHGDLKEEVYLKLPFGMPTSSPNDVCKLKSSLSGLKQAPQVWFEKFRSTLLGFSFTQNLGQLTYFLGLEVHHQPYGLFLHQHKYSQDLVQLAGLTNTTSVNTPMELNVKYRRDDGELLEDPTTYRKLFMQAPRHHHLSAVRRIIRYILGTPSRGLFFPTGSSLQLQAYSDADWAGCPDTRRSTTGWCMFLGDALISWKCKKQDHVSKSSTEAEYRAMSAACSEIIWLRGLFTELGFSPLHPTPLHADNTSAIQIAANPSITNAPSTSRLTVTQSEKPMIIRLSPFHMSPLLCRLPISSPNPCHVSAIISSLAN